MAVCDQDHLSNPITSGGSNFRDMAHKSGNANVRQQYFLPVYEYNSDYGLKFVLPALACLQKGEVIDSALIDGSFPYNNIPISSEKLLLLEFKWKMIENSNTYLNKIRLLDFLQFLPKSSNHLNQVKKKTILLIVFPSSNNTFQLMKCMIY